MIFFYVQLFYSFTVLVNLVLIFLFFPTVEKIRVGKDYQAIVPELNPKSDNNITEKALLVWAPATFISDSRLEQYVELANNTYGYNTEQALGMLYWHKHDLEKAFSDLGNFTPFLEEWSKEDKILFEQAFQFHGKCFHRIRQMVSSLTSNIV